MVEYKAEIIKTPKHFDIYTVVKNDKGGFDRVCKTFKQLRFNCISNGGHSCYTFGHSHTDHISAIKCNVKVAWGKSIIVTVMTGYGNDAEFDYYEQQIDSKARLYPMLKAKDEEVNRRILKRHKEHTKLFNKYLTDNGFDLSVRLIKQLEYPGVW